MARIKESLEEKNSFNAYSALEMVIIRMSYVSDLQTPAEIINSLDGVEENKKKKISENNKKNQNKTYVESNISNEPNSESINSFEIIVIFRRSRFS